MRSIFAAALLTFSFSTCLSQSFRAELAYSFPAKILKESSSYAFKVDFSPNENIFFVVEDKKSLSIWDAEKNQPKYSFPGSFSQVKFSPNGKNILAVAKNQINIIDVNSGNISSPFKKYEKKIAFTKWAPDGKNIAVFISGFQIDVLNAETGKLINTFVIEKKKRNFLERGLNIQFLANGTFTPDGKRLLTCTENESAELWDLETGKRLREFVHPDMVTRQTINRCEISPDGKWILTGNYDEQRLWKTETGEFVEVFKGFNLPRFSPNNRYLGLFYYPGAEQRSTAIFDLSSLKLIQIFDKYSGRIDAWSKEKYIVTDRTTDEVYKDAAFIWSVGDWKQKASLKTYSKHCFDFVSTCISDSDRFTFSPNEKLLMSQNEKTIKFLNPENGEIITNLDNSSAPALWSDDGKFILAKSNEKDKMNLFKISY